MIQDWSAYYDEVKALTRNLPGLRGRGEHGVETVRWAGQLYAAVQKLDDPYLLQLARSLPGSSSVGDRNSYGQRMLNALFGALAVAEGHNPQASGLFVPVGGVDDFHKALDHVFERASKSVWVIDPYIDAKALDEARNRMPAGVELRLFGDSFRPQANFTLALAAWRASAGNAPLEARLSPAKALHDRLIVIDGQEVWNCTQSIKDFANRSPGAIEKSYGDVAAMKIAAYEGIWQSSTSI